MGEHYKPLNREIFLSGMDFFIGLEKIAAWFFFSAAEKSGRMEIFFCVAEDGGHMGNIFDKYEKKLCLLRKMVA